MKSFRSSRSRLFPNIDSPEASYPGAFSVEAWTIFSGHGAGRVFAGYAVVEGLNGIHILGQIPGGVDHGTESADLAAIIKKAQGNWNTCAAGDVVKARFPADNTLASSGRSDG